MRVAAVLLAVLLLSAAPVGTEPAPAGQAAAQTPPGAAYEEELEEFVPSEEVSAERAIAFPVDI